MSALAKPVTAHADSATGHSILATTLLIHARDHRSDTPSTSATAKVTEETRFEAATRADDLPSPAKTLGRKRIRVVAGTLSAAKEGVGRSRM
jgi:hypothetical protein